jgi:hypothetical protein
MVPEAAWFVVVTPRPKTPEYSSSAQLAGAPPDRWMANDVDATEPPALVDHISVLTAVPLFA